MSQSLPRLISLETRAGNRRSGFEPRFTPGGMSPVYGQSALSDVSGDHGARRKTKE
jgi:hypothetical protein